MRLVATSFGRLPLGAGDKDDDERFDEEQNTWLSLSIRAENKSYLNVNNNRSSPLENNKDQLLVACIQAKSGINVSNEEKDSVEEVIQSVEQYQDKDANIEDLAMGYWRVIYSTAPPPSNGQVIGPIVGTAFQSINKDNATYENVLAVGNWLTLRLKATYEVLENNRWTVTFKSIQVELLKKEPCLWTFGRDEKSG